MRCERRIHELVKRPSLIGAPGLEQQRTRILMRAKGEPVLFKRAPRLDTSDEERAELDRFRAREERSVELVQEARRRLDQAQLEHVKVFASGGLDEAVIGDLVRAGAPIDAFGVGSALVCSSDKPALDVACKLVEYADECLPDPQSRPRHAKR